MDDQTVQQNQPVNNQPIQPITVPQPPVVPASSSNKEGSPLSHAETGNYLSPTEVEPVLHPEVQEAGVEVVEVPELQLHDKKIGMMPAKESVPVATAPSGAVTLPLTPQEALSTVKKDKNVTHSIVWLAQMVLRQVKMKNK